MGNLKMCDKPAVVISFAKVFFNLLKSYLRTFQMRPQKGEAAS